MSDQRQTNNHIGQFLLVSYSAVDGGAEIPRDFDFVFVLGQLQKGVPGCLANDNKHSAATLLAYQSGFIIINLSSNTSGSNLHILSFLAGMIQESA
jgi:hypothetical protein